MSSYPTRYTIIPDVHGRPFWRDAVRDVDTTPVVFLGDYLDPYPQDGVKWSQAWKGLQDIVALKKRHPDRVTLLLGNHDVHYLPGYPFFNMGSRHDGWHAERIEEFFLQNLHLFDIAKTVPRGDGRPFLLTHAGVLNAWVSQVIHSLHPDIPKAYDFVEAVVDTKGNPEAFARLLNDTLHTGNEAMFRFFMMVLGCVPGSRGSRDNGSCVWADIGDLKYPEDLFPDCIHIVGHTRQDTFIGLPGHPRCKTNAYCTDYGRAMTLEPGVSPFLRFKNELKTSFSYSDLAAAPKYFIFGLWLWNLSDEARRQAGDVIAEAVSKDYVRIHADGAYYIFNNEMRIFKHERDLPDWVYKEWNRIRPQLDGMKPEDLTSVLLGENHPDKYHKPQW